ncbi:Flp family type IVb pilin [Streptomyces sp. NPDC091280]|uniref:Flp family type IVb pilin n=1 Tax=Streptomyces sp. NPDC091280 TaxID=3365984 RepID=UPI00382756EA
MASIGGTGGEVGGSGGRCAMPAPLAAALVLVHALLAVTVVGGLGVLSTAASYDTLDGQVVALVAYAATPGVLGWWLARRSWEGGTRVRLGLLAVQGWLILGGVVNLVSGSARGGLQLFLPIVVVFLLLRPESREWYGLAGLERAERRPFSLARLIRWRRDEGQTAVEYAGFIAIVAAIVTALLVSGLGTQIFSGIQSEVCKVTGVGCGSGTGDGTTTTTGTGTTAGDKPAPAPVTGKKDDKGDGSDGGDDHGCFSGVGAFFGCAGDQVKQVGQGLFVDGVWGDLTGIWDMVRHPVDTVKGIGDYGKQLGDDWSKNSKDAGKKWSDGDYGGALWDWTGASVKTGGTVLYDLFIGDDVAKDWNNGDKTRAVTHVLWNVGSLFIPGYDGAKIVEKVGDLGKIGKLGKLGELAEKAGKAAEDAKKAAKAGDVAGAEKAAKEADDAADAAEKKARESGCVIGAPAHRIPYGDGGGPTFGGTGTGTTVLAAGSAPYVVLAQGKDCDEDAEKEAEEARKQADEADKAADRWEAGDDVPGPARGKTLRFPNKRHTVSGAGSGQIREENTVILRGNEDLVRADIEGIAKNRATLSADGNTYEINGRKYRVEGNGTVFPVSGPGLVEMDRTEYAALKEIVRNKGDLGKSQALQRDPKFVNNPEKVAKAKQVYDGTYK